MSAPHGRKVQNAEVVKLQEGSMELHTVKCHCGCLVVFEERPLMPEAVAVYRVEESIIGPGLKLINTHIWYEVEGEEMPAETDAMRAVEKALRERKDSNGV